MQVKVIVFTDRREMTQLNKPIALLPMLLLLVPGMVAATQLTAQNLGAYLPLVGLLVVATAINVVMLVNHRARQEQKR